MRFEENRTEEEGEGEVVQGTVIIIKRMGQGRNNGNSSSPQQQHNNSNLEAAGETRASPTWRVETPIKPSSASWPVPDPIARSSIYSDKVYRLPCSGCLLFAP